MSVESTITKVVYQGNGAAKEWPVPFQYNKPEHLHLMVTDAAGAHELVSSNYQVQVTEAGDTSILYPVSGLPLSAGKRLTIYRATPQTQIVDLIYGGAFAPEVLEEDGLDREVMMIQELQESIDRAVKVDMDSEETPEELRDSLFAARDQAVASATSAGASATAAGNSAQSASGSAAIATEQREAACACAEVANLARDAAIAQTEAANTLMEAELAKVNAIVAANKSDQQAAIEAARLWAEMAPDVPVEYDEEGNPHYSARHWALLALLHALNPDGTTVEVDEDGVLHARLINDEVLITESGTWEVPVTGWYDVEIINGGCGGICFRGYNGEWGAVGGPAGERGRKLVYLEAGTQIPVTIGAAGQGGDAASTTHAMYSGGLTTFGEVSVSSLDRYGYRAGSLSIYFPSGTSGFNALYGFGCGPGGGNATYAPLSATTAGWQHNANCDGGYWGAGGGAYVHKNGFSCSGNGKQGAVILRFYNPLKAAGPAPAPALLMARAAARVATQPATVNLYDPETGQGSVWLEEDAPAKLAEGLISQEAWQEICQAKAAEERAAWLASPDTEAERFDLLQAACKQRMDATDKLVQPDYPLSTEDRAAVYAYRTAIRELNHQEGAPWDGGGELTPWPEEPAVEKAQA